MQHTVEPEASQQRKLAILEIGWRSKQKNKDRLISYRYEPALDVKGKPYQRLHRTRVYTGPTNQPIESDV
jgi:hypothetical protein